MKQFYLFALSLAALAGTAQSSIKLYNLTTGSVIAVNSTVALTTNTLQQTKLTLDVQNTGSVTNSYNVKRYDIKLNYPTSCADTAAAYFCFGGLCFGPATYTGNSAVTLTANAKTSQATGPDAQFFPLQADLDEGCLIGCSIVKYTFFNTANTNDSAQITLMYNNCTGVSLRENSRQETNIELFPNPAHSAFVINVESQKATRGEIMILNAIGANVYSTKVNLREGENRVPVNSQHLAAGIYFVTVQAGNSTATRKLIIE